MTRSAVDAAARHANLLPGFKNQEEAERTLFADRDSLLRQLLAAADRTGVFKPTFEPDSLKTLETWYFELREADAFGKIGVDKGSFERAMAMYFGEALVRNRPEFQWFVVEFAFQVGKYELGVRTPSLSVMLHSFGELLERPNNRRRQSMWREFRRYAV